MNFLNTKRTKCLIIHGFGGGVYEIKPLAEFLTALGYEVICPVLKGHSSTKKDMKKASFHDWIDSAEQELLKLKEIGDNIILIGFSMGGLIAFNLAFKHKVKGVITINTPIYYWNIKQVLLNLIDDMKNNKCTHIRRYLKAKNNSPLSAMLQFLLLLKQTKPKLQKITCPILITQAEDDDTVRRRSVDYIFKHVSSTRKLTTYFSKGGHLILLSPNSEQVMLYIKNYLIELELLP